MSQLDQSHTDLEKDWNVISILQYGYALVRSSYLKIGTVFTWIMYALVSSFLELISLYVCGQGGFKEAIVSIQLLYRFRNDLGERQNSIGMHDSTNTIIAMIYLQTGPYKNNKCRVRHLEGVGVKCPRCPNPLRDRHVWCCCLMLGAFKIQKVWLWVGLVSYHWIH